MYQEVRIYSDTSTISAFCRLHSSRASCMCPSTSPCIALGDMIEDGARAPKRGHGVQGRLGGGVNLGQS